MACSQAAGEGTGADQASCRRLKKRAATRVVGANETRRFAPRVWKEASRAVKAAKAPATPTVASLEIPDPVPHAQAAGSDGQLGNDAGGQQPWTTLDVSPDSQDAPASDFFRAFLGVDSNSPEYTLQPTAVHPPPPTASSPYANVGYNAPAGFGGYEYPDPSQPHNNHFVFGIGDGRDFTFGSETAANTNGHDAPLVSGYDPVWAPSPSPNPFDESSIDPALTSG